MITRFLAGFGATVVLWIIFSYLKKYVREEYVKDIN